jgi:hypothetical protein
MIRAAAHRGIDFSQAAPDDRRWWKRLGWLLNELEGQDLLRNLEHLQRFQLGVLPLLADNARKTVVDELASLAGLMNELLFPWESKDGKRVPGKSDTSEMRRQLVERFGDPQDPAVKEKIARALEASRKERDKTQQAGKPRPRRKRRRVPEHQES